MSEGKRVRAAMLAMSEQKEMPLDVPQVVVDDLPWSYKDEEPEGDDE